MHKSLYLYIYLLSIYLSVFINLISCLCLINLSSVCQCVYQFIITHNDKTPFHYITQQTDQNKRYFTCLLLNRSPVHLPVHVQWNLNTFFFFLGVYINFSRFLYSYIRLLSCLSVNLFSRSFNLFVPSIWFNYQSLYKIITKRHIYIVIPVCVLAYK